ncbi:hypothetical protein FQR65_LT17261 [Abscondita terminalis]|nr:hypothetical protein FQR65_LT17261 [Abscondita terminalis]
MVIRAGDYEYDINIRFNQLNRSSVDDVKSIIFVNSKGEKIKLDQFATITEGSGPSFLERRDKSPSVTINAQTVGIPTGVNYVWSGDMENQSEGFGTLGIALMAAIILVYLVMVALYDSFVYPFVVLFSVPLSLLIGRLLHQSDNKGGKVDYAKEMIADYEPLEMSEDGFTQEHHHNNVGK